MLNLSRRSFLSVGGLGLLSMPQVLRAQEESGTSHKAVINIFLGGGPPHQDMWDIKTEAPSEIRGPFKPISTNVAGGYIGEGFPQIASMFDKFTAVRSVVGSDGAHDGYQCVTGWSRKDMVSGVNCPAIGACASKIWGLLILPYQLRWDWQSLHSTTLGQKLEVLVILEIHTSHLSQMVR